MTENKTIFPIECRELHETIDEIYYSYLLLPLEELSAKLNSNNDSKDIRTLFYKTKKELEAYIDPDGLKRKKQEVI